MKEKEQTGTRAKAKESGKKAPEAKAKGKGKGGEKKMSLKMRLLLNLIIALVSVVAIIALLIVCGMVMPHDKHFDLVNVYDDYKFEEGEKGSEYEYHYIAHAFQGVCFIDSEYDIAEEVIGGDCDLMIRIIGIRWYKTDNSGMNIKYPVIAYEYVRIEDDDR